MSAKNEEIVLSKKDDAYFLIEECILQLREEKVHPLVIIKQLETVQKLILEEE